MVVVVVVCVCVCGGVRLCEIESLMEEREGEEGGVKR